MTPSDRRFLSGVYAKAEKMRRRRTMFAQAALALLGALLVVCACVFARGDAAVFCLIGAPSLLLFIAVDWIRLKPEQGDQM